jgi:hypothetical protein
MQTERKYWFPAKRYGWGWGIPSSWQGWLVFWLKGEPPRWRWGGDERA